MQEVERKRNILINIAYLAVMVTIALFAIRYATGVCLPFVIAFLVAAILQRPKNFLVKKTFLKKGAASAICVFVALFIIAALISLVGVRLFSELKSFANYIVEQLKDIDVIVDNIEKWLLSVINVLPEFLKKTLTENTAELFEKIRQMISGDAGEAASQITSQIGSKFEFSWIAGPLGSVISTAKQVPSMLIAFVITIVASCFMTSEYNDVIAFIKLQFPEERRSDLSRAKALLKSSLGKMGKAYALIILVTFTEMSIGLTVLRLLGIFSSPYILIISAVTALVDIIPVLGTGTIVIPWAVYSLITANYGMGIGLIVIYILITVIRQIIEPKLVAGQLGLSPIITIGALYFGLKIIGVLGVFIMPIFVIMLKLLNDEGIIKLWRSPARERKKAQEAQNNNGGTENESENAQAKNTAKIDDTSNTD